MAIGDGPEPRRLGNDLAVVAGAAREAFRSDETITGRQLHART
ncbi:hypothetical protein [Streptomyces sp. NBC_01276]